VCSTTRLGRCRTSRLQDHRVQEYRLPSPPSMKCNVLRESLSEESQNIPCATLKRRGSWVISVYISEYHHLKLFIYSRRRPDLRLLVEFLRRLFLRFLSCFVPGNQLVNTDQSTPSQSPPPPAVFSTSPPNSPSPTIDSNPQPCTSSSLHLLTALPQPCTSSSLHLFASSPQPCTSSSLHLFASSHSLQEEGLQDEGLQEEGLQEAGLQEEGQHEEGLEDEGLHGRGRQEQESSLYGRFEYGLFFTF
jgi:hypothetical protein